MRRTYAVYGAILLIAAAIGIIPALATNEIVDRVLEDDRITEASGLAASTVHDDVLYTHNDSDDGPRLYAVGPDGETVAVLTLDGVEARDWEAMAPGKRGSKTVWVGDIGDNLSIWETVPVYRVKEPADLRTQDVESTRYDFEFEDGPRDAEALMVHPETGRLYVVSKRASNAAVYVAPERLKTDSPNVLTKVADAPSMITDGAWSPDGDHYVLRGYVGATVFDGRDLGREVRDVDLPAQRQGESIAWTPDGSALLSGSEGANSKVYRVDVDLDGDRADGSGAQQAAAEASGDEPVVSPGGSTAESTAGASTDDGRRGLILLAIAAAALVGLGVGLHTWSRND